VPHGVYRAAGDDRWVAIAVTTDAQFTALAEVLDLPIDLPRNLDGPSRRAARDRLGDLVAERVAREDHLSLAERLQEAGVPAAPVHDAEGVVDRDPQLAARRHWVRLNHDEMGETLYSNLPFRFSATPTELTIQAPMLGEHTTEVCRDVLGMEDSEIERLVSEGVLA